MVQGAGRAIGERHSAARARCLYTCGSTVLEFTRKMWTRWYQTGRLRHEIAAWRMAGKLTPAGIEHVRQHSKAVPGQQDWIDFVRQLTAWLGCIMLASAAVCAVAANWAQISAPMRLAALQAAMVLAVAATLLPGVSRLMHTLLLLLACVLLGAVLAQLGQTYQTGADPWELFALWALLMLPWVVAGRSVVLWLLWVLIGNVALVLWGGEQGEARAPTTLAVFAFWNGALLVAWETAWPRLAWVRRMAGPRLVTLWLVGGLAAYAAIETGLAEVFWTPAMMWWLFATGAVIAFYRYGRRDVAILAVALFGVIVVVTVQCGLRIGQATNAGSGLFALLALLVVLQAVGAAAWLRRLSGDQP